VASEILQELHGAKQQVVKIEGAGFAENFLVRLIHLAGCNARASLCFAASLKTCAGVIPGFREADPFQQPATRLPDPDLELLEASFTTAVWSSAS